MKVTKGRPHGSSDGVVALKQETITLHLLTDTEEENVQFQAKPEASLQNPEFLHPGYVVLGSHIPIGPTIQVLYLVVPPESLLPCKWNPKTCQIGIYWSHYRDENKTGWSRTSVVPVK